MSKSIYYDGDRISGGASKEIYSTVETRIGTWIDGKPLYRRVISGTSPSKYNEAVQVGVIEDFGMPATITGVLLSTDGGFIPIPYVIIPSSATNTSYATAYVSADGKIYVSTNGPYFINRQMWIIIEYTKNTDTVSQSLSSTVLPKSSGSVIHDGKEYDYELADIVSADGSATANLNVVGSIARDIL